MVLPDLARAVAAGTLDTGSTQDIRRMAVITLDTWERYSRNRIRRLRLVASGWHDLATTRETAVRRRLALHFPDLGLAL